MAGNALGSVGISTRPGCKCRFDSQRFNVAYPFGALRIQHPFGLLPALSVLKYLHVRSAPVLETRYFHSGLANSQQKPGGVRAFARLLVVGVIALGAPVAMAGHVSELKRVNAAISAHSKEEKQLNDREASVRRKVDSMRVDLTKMASRVQQREHTLTEMEQQISQLHAEVTRRRSELAVQRHVLEQLLHGMVRFSSVPEPLLLNSSDDLSRHFLAASVMQRSSMTLTENARKLRDEIVALEDVEGQLKSKREEKEQANQQLVRARRALESQLLARQSLQQELQQDRSRLQARVDGLSKQAKSLQGLIARLEADRKTNIVPKTRPSTQVAKQMAKGRVLSTVATVPQMRLPAQGRIQHNYGDRMENGQLAEGLHLQTREQARVVAPSSGKVVYAGPFRGYGKLVIIRHDSRNHTLLSGMSRLDVSTGMRVGAGEPIGAMPTLAEAKPVLYVERRKDNRPVKPAPWLPALSTRQLAARDS